MLKRIKQMGLIASIVTLFWLLIKLIIFIIKWSRNANLIKNILGD